MGFSACFLYSFPFLGVEPKYKCLINGVWTPCGSQQFCPPNMNVPNVIDWDDGETINNLIVQFNLQCNGALAVGFFGSFFLAGIVIGSVTITRIGDTYGRRQGFLVGLILQSVITFLMLFISSAYVAYFFCLLIGIGCTGKQYVGWNLLLEYQPKNKQVLIGCLEFIFEALIFIFITVYFGWIAKEWRYMQLPIVMFGVIGSAFLVWTPESPRFLVGIRNYDKARVALNRIAQFNGMGVGVANGFIFDKEYSEGKT